MSELDNILSELDNALDGLNTSLSGGYQQPSYNAPSYNAPPPSYNAPPPARPSPPVPQSVAPVKSQPPVPQQQAVSPPQSPPPGSAEGLSRQPSRTADLQKQLEEIRARKEARASQAPGAVSSGNEEWKQATSANGKVYYYNTKTKETRWTKPDGMDGGGISSSQSPPPTRPGSGFGGPASNVSIPLPSNPQPVSSAPPPASHQNSMSPPPQRQQGGMPSQPSAKGFEIPRPGGGGQQPSPVPTPVQQPKVPVVQPQIPIVKANPPMGGGGGMAIPKPVAATPSPVPMGGIKPSVVPQGVPLQSQPWYYGNISRQDTENILRNARKNGFIVRDSSQQGCYACSMLDVSKNQVHHTLIVKGPKGYHFEEQPEFGEFIDVATLVKSTPLLQQFTPVNK